MKDTTQRLPAGFESLECFVDGWAIEGANNRLQRRLGSEPGERQEFFSAFKDLAPAALDLLDKKPLDQLDDDERRLMNLLLSLVHVSLAVEIQRDHEPYHASYARFITINHAPADIGP